jgi:hypothetical protein
VKGTRFDPSEVPSGLYGNAVPADHTLPPSLYLRARPAWFGETPLPAIGPDVTGGSEVAGHAHKIPARVCFERTPQIEGVLSFDAGRCYRRP